MTLSADPEVGQLVVDLEQHGPQSVQVRGTCLCGRGELFHIFAQPHLRPVLEEVGQDALRRRMSPLQDGARPLLPVNRQRGVRIALETCHKEVHLGNVQVAKLDRVPSLVLRQQGQVREESLGEWSVAETTIKNTECCLPHEPPPDSQTSMAHLSVRLASCLAHSAGKRPPEPPLPINSLRASGFQHAMMKSFAAVLVSQENACLNLVLNP